MVPWWVREVESLETGAPRGPELLRALRVVAGTLRRIHRGRKCRISEESKSCYIREKEKGIVSETPQKGVEEKTTVECLTRVEKLSKRPIM